MVLNVVGSNPTSHPKRKYLSGIIRLLFDSMLKKTAAPLVSIGIFQNLSMPKMAVSSLIRVTLDGAIFIIVKMKTLRN